MAQITINIPDPFVSKVLSAFAAKFSYVTEGTGLTQTQFAKKKIIEYIKSVVYDHEVIQEVSVAAENKRLEVYSIDIT